MANTSDDLGRTVLHEAALWGKLPTDVTIAILTSVRGDSGWTALHDAARYGNLPHGVTIHDLMSVMDNNGRTALDALADEIHGSQIEAVLNASKANSFEEILKVGSTMERMKRVKVITWMAFQMKLLWTKNNS